MKQANIPLIMNGLEPAVIQLELRTIRLSWNPDDGRFYVETSDLDYPDEWRTRGVFDSREEAVREVQEQLNLLPGVQ